MNYNYNSFGYIIFVYNEGEYTNENNIWPNPSPTENTWQLIQMSFINEIDKKLASVSYPFSQIETYLISFIAYIIHNCFVLYLFNNGLTVILCRI